MNRWVWVGALALVCVVLAFLLFRPPDTGADVAGTPGGAAAGSEVGRGSTAGAEPGAGREGERVTAPLRARPRPSDAELPPGLAEQRAWRGRPAAVYATRVLSPFSTIRFTLLKEGSPEARALADQLGTGVMQDLRGVRSSEEEDPLTGLSPRLQAEVATIAASPWGKEPIVATSLEKITNQLAEFEKVKSGELAEPLPAPGAEEGGEGTAAP